MSTNDPPEASPLPRRRAYSSLLWQAAGTSLTAVANLIFLMVMGRLLEPSDFGAFALASVVIAVLQILAQFGIGAALVQRERLEENEAGLAMVTVVLAALALCLIIGMLAGPLERSFDGKLDANVLRVLSLSLLFTSFGIASRAMLMRDLEFRALFRSDTASYIVGNVAVGIAFAATGAGVWSLVAGMLCANALASLACLWHRPVGWPDTRHRVATAASVRALFAYGSRLTGVQLLNQFAQQVDKLILGKLLPLAALGAFERAQRLQGLPVVYAGHFIDGVLFSVMSRHVEEPERLGRFYFSFVGLLSFATVYLSALLWLYSPEITALVLGPGWQRAAELLAVLAVLVYVQTFTRFGDTLVRSTGAFRASARAKAMFIVATIALTIGGERLGGLTGAVVGVVLAHTFHGAAMAGVAMRTTRQTPLGILHRVSPALLFGVVLVFKGLLVRTIGGDQLATTLALQFGSDALLLALLYARPTLLGRDNARFLVARLNESGLAAPLARGLAERLERLTGR